MKKFLSICLATLMCFSIVACKDMGDSSSDNSSPDSSVVETPKTFSDYVANGLFKEDYAVSMETSIESTPNAAINLCLLFITDEDLKARVSAATKASDYFVSSTVFFMADGTCYIVNEYTDLMVEFRGALTGSTDDNVLRKETVNGTYTISSQANAETGEYAITMTKASDSSTVAFTFDVESSDIKGGQFMTSEIYKKDETATLPEKGINDYLTANGYLKKNAVDAAKADYYLVNNSTATFNAETKTKINALSDATLKAQMNAVTKASEIYSSSVVSFTETGKVVLTNYYTELGVKYMEAQGKTVSVDEAEVLRGTYSVSLTAIAGTNNYEIALNFGTSGTTTFALNAANGKLYRSELFEQEDFTPFTTADILANSGAGYATESWTEGVDGTTYSNVKYGDRERNLLDVYIPATLDNTKQNGVILFIHGGSWVGGGKDDMANLCKKYAKMGYVTASMSHTYAMSEIENGQKCTFLTINDEVDAVFAKIKSMSDENGWNIKQAALSGYSSGCHLAYLYAYSKGNEADAPIPVKMVAGMVGCLDFRQEYWQNVATYGPGVAALGLNDPRLNLLETTKPYSEEEYNAIIDTISPLAFAKKGDAVPSVIAYAELDDNLIDYVFGAELTNVLNGHNIEVSCTMLPNSGHVCGNNPVEVKKYNDAFASFLRKYFGY